MNYNAGPKVTAADFSAIAANAALAALVKLPLAQISTALDTALAAAGFTAPQRAIIKPLAMYVAVQLRKGQ